MRKSYIQCVCSVLYGILPAGINDRSRISAALFLAPERQKLSGTYAGLACPFQAGHKNIDTEGWSVIFVCLTFEKSTGATAEVIKSNIQGTSLGARRAKLKTSSDFVAAVLMAGAGRTTKVKLRMALAHGAMQAL